MLIRRAQASESAALSALAQRSKSHWGYPAAQLAIWRVNLIISPQAIEQRPVHVAELAGQAAGFYVLAPGESDWQLEHFWIAPPYMGQGIGRALLAHARDVARQGGASYLAIDADPFAEAFYLACGASRVGEVAAPIDGEPGRVRPQLRLAVQTTETPATRLEGSA